MGLIKHAFKFAFDVAADHVEELNQIRVTLRDCPWRGVDTVNLRGVSYAELLDWGTGLDFRKQIVMRFRWARSVCLFCGAQCGVSEFTDAVLHEKIGARA